MPTTDASDKKMYALISSHDNRLKQQWVTAWVFLKLSPMVIWTDPVARKPMADVIF